MRVRASPAPRRDASSRTRALLRASRRPHRVYLHASSPPHSESRRESQWPPPSACSAQREAGLGGAAWRHTRSLAPARPTPVGATPFGARYLNARLGRWMSPDPLSVHAAAADLNVYAYVGGRVASHVDPWGLEGVATDTGGPNGNTFWSFPSTSGSYTTTSERTTTTVSWSYQSPLAGFAARMLQEAVVIAERGLDGLSQNADLLGPLAGDAVSLGNKLAQPGANITPGGVLEGVYEEAGSAGIRQVLKLPDIGIRSGGPGDVGPEVGRFGARYGLASLVGAGEAAAERAAGAEGGGARRLLTHYTNEAGMNGILESQELRASTKAANPSDVRYGNGQYLSDIRPGSRRPAQLSRAFLNNPFQGSRFTHFVTIDVTGLDLIQGRPGVYVIPNDVALPLQGRIVNFGLNFPVPLP